MSEDEIVSRILNGQERVWRFTDKEQSGSADVADRLLWLGILRAERELAAAVFGSVCAGAGQSAGDTPTPCRFLKTLAQPLPKTFAALTGELGFYEDRGQESILDNDGYPVKPTAEQIREAVAALPIALQELSACESEGGKVSSDSSGGTSEALKIRFYNSDYYISDLQPGRNTVLDARTGRVRFIDPRITLNDPDGPVTPVTTIGKRKEDLPGQFFG